MTQPERTMSVIGAIDSGHKIEYDQCYCTECRILMDEGDVIDNECENCGERTAVPVFIVWAKP